MRKCTSIDWGMQVFIDHPYLDFKIAWNFFYVNWQINPKNFIVNILMRQCNWICSLSKLIPHQYHILNDKFNDGILLSQRFLWWYKYEIKVEKSNIQLRCQNIISNIQNFKINYLCWYFTIPIMYLSIYKIQEII